MEAAGHYKYLGGWGEGGAGLLYPGGHVGFAQEVDGGDVGIGGADGGAEAMGAFHVDFRREGGVDLEEGVPECVEVLYSQALAQGGYIVAVA